MFSTFNKTKQHIACGILSENLLRRRKII